MQPAQPVSEEEATTQCTIKVRPPNIMINQGLEPHQCLERATHNPCCSSHGRPMCCEHYNRLHFVEVNRCTPATHRPRGTQSTFTTPKISTHRNAQVLRDMGHDV